VILFRLIFRFKIWTFIFSTAWWVG